GTDNCGAMFTCNGSVCLLPDTCNGGTCSCVPDSLQTTCGTDCSGDTRTNNCGAGVRCDTSVCPTQECSINGTCCTPSSTCSNKCGSFVDECGVPQNCSLCGQGQICDAPTDCASGYCEQGFCCERDCSFGPCEACDGSTGSPPGICTGIYEAELP